MNQSGCFLDLKKKKGQLYNCFPSTASKEKMIKEMNSLPMPLNEKQHPRWPRIHIFTNKLK